MGGQAPGGRGGRGPSLDQPRHFGMGPPVQADGQALAFDEHLDRHGRLGLVGDLHHHGAPVGRVPPLPDFPLAVRWAARFLQAVEAGQDDRALDRAEPLDQVRHRSSRDDGDAAIAAGQCGQRVDRPGQRSGLPRVDDDR